MNETRRFDVAIAGGGPAGATLAALLAQRGVSVALIERDTFPRDKLCGEFLSYDALPALEIIGLAFAIDEAGAARIRTCRMIGAKRVYEFGFPREACGISRLRLDAMIFRRAIELGAHTFEGWAVDRITRNSDGHEITLTNREREAMQIHARVVAGAWGRWGRLDRQLDRPFTHDQARRHFGFKRHYRTRLEGQVSKSDTIDLYSFGRGYLGVNPIEDGIVNICGLVHAARLERNKGGWETLVAQIAEESAPLSRLFAAHEAAQEHFLSSEPVIFAARSPVVDGILMIGDAAGLIDPLAGNGMAMGIQSALLAAPLIARHLRAEISQDSLSRQYDANYRSYFESRIRWSRRVAWLLSRPNLVDLSTTFVHVRSIGRFLLGATRATDAQVDELADRYGALTSP